MREYVASKGYRLVARTRPCSAVMRDGAGDKIFVKRDHDGHYIHFSIRNDRDNATIIDFVQHRMPIGLGQVRKELRLWTGRTKAVPVYAELE
jgi:hypothetical protein